METTASTPSGANGQNPSSAPEAANRPNVPDIDEHVPTRFDRGKPKVEKKADEPDKSDSDGPKTPPDLKPDQVRELIKGKKEDAEESESKEAKPAKNESKKEDEKREKIKAKIDGEEIEVDLEEDFPGITELWPKLKDDQKEKFLRNFQKYRTASKRLQESAIIKRQATDLIKALQTNPFEVLRHPKLGITPEKYREMLEGELYKFVELEAMDPKDREIHELKHKLKVEEDGKKKEADEANEREMAELTEHHTSNYSEQIIGAIEAAGLPRSEHTVGLYAKYLRMALDRGVRLKADQVSDLVKEDIEKMYKHMFASADGERLISIFGDDIAKKISKAQIDAVKKGTPPATTSAGAGSTRKVVRGLSHEEWRERNRRIKEGRE